MNIETYHDKVLDQLEKKHGFTQPQLLVAKMTISQLVAHCHMKDVAIEKAADGIAQQLKEYEA